MTPLVDTQLDQQVEAFSTQLRSPVVGQVVRRREAVSRHEVLGGERESVTPLRQDGCMTDDEVAAAMMWIDSIDFSTADNVTCEEALSVLGELRDRFDAALGRLVVRLQPPRCSIHCRVRLRSIGS